MSLKSPPSRRRRHVHHQPALRRVQSSNGKVVQKPTPRRPYVRRIRRPVEEKPRRKLIRRLTEWQKLQIESLAMLGYEHRYIASWVFTKPIKRVDVDERDSITAYIVARSFHVTDWRKGLNSMASSFAQDAVESAQKAFGRKPK